MCGFYGAAVPAAATAVRGRDDAAGELRMHRWMWLLCAQTIFQRVANWLCLLFLLLLWVELLLLLLWLMMLLLLLSGFQALDVVHFAAVALFSSLALALSRSQADCKLIKKPVRSLVADVRCRRGSGGWGVGLSLAGGGSDAARRLRRSPAKS